MILRSILIFFFIVMFTPLIYGLEIVEKEWGNINGVQIFVLNEGEALDGYFHQLKKMGVNTVFFRVFHNNRDRAHFMKVNQCPEGGVYFATDNACVVEDLLDDVVNSAHKYNIEVYAWMATRSLSFIKSRSMSQSFSPDGVVPGYGANLFDKTVSDEIKTLLLELAAHDIDGILIQDDFIYKYSEGADEYACNAFTNDTGLECSVKSFFSDNTGYRIFANRGQNYESWISWKAQYLNNFLSDVRSDARLINPDMKWAVNVYYETPVFPDKGLSWYSQDLKRIWDTGVDYIAVMAYEEQIKKEMGLDSVRFSSFISDLAFKSIKSAPGWNSSRAIFKLQVKSFATGDKLSRASFYETCRNIQRAGGSSFVQLPVGGTDDIQTPCGL